MIEQPQIVQTSARPTAVIHVTVPREQIREVMGPTRGELMAALAAQGIATAGPWFTHHLRIDPAVFDFELGVPVATPVTAAGRMAPGEIPAEAMARTVLYGGYEGLGAAWEEFDTWIVAQGYIPADDVWECYLVGPESNSDAAEWRTELRRGITHLRTS
ncbi:MAG: GyrI-like domain-containing protein [Anaerolineae bacterium]